MGASQEEQRQLGREGRSDEALAYRYMEPPGRLWNTYTTTILRYSWG